MADSSWSEYVDVLSTSSNDLYPDNTNSNFTNLLPVAQDLPENTYVALEEISYSHLFYNINTTENEITVFDPLFKNEPGSKLNPYKFPLYGKYFIVQLREGYYETMQDICDMLNKSLAQTGMEQFKNCQIFQYDHQNLKCHYDVTDIFASLWIKGNLLNMMGVELEPAKDSQAVMLGHEKKTPTYEWYEEREREEEREVEEKQPDGTIKKVKKKVKVKYKVKVIHRYLNPTQHWEASVPKNSFKYVSQLTTFQSMVVYCDIIASQVTGESFTDTLRFLPLYKYASGTQVVHEVKVPHYLKVRQRYIKSINIQIKDLQGNFIDFKMGHVRVKLRFKQL